MDPISDMIIKIKNASNASKEAVTMPYSKIKFAIATALMKTGFVGEVAKRTKKGRSLLEIAIAYEAPGIPRLHDVKRASKPSRRIYKGVKDLRPVRQGYGITLLSTPKGILTDREARKEHVGGEVLLTIW
ncbi:MAG: 30S ribosomal protein S8 [Candidatus Paceibacterota bacterium]|jgi:small subunit ribosomal protein S8